MCIQIALYHRITVIQCAFNSTSPVFHFSYSIFFSNLSTLKQCVYKVQGWQIYAHRRLKLRGTHAIQNCTNNEAQSRVHWPFWNDTRSQTVQLCAGIINKNVPRNRAENTIWHMCTKRKKIFVLSCDVSFYVYEVYCRNLPCRTMSEHSLSKSRLYVWFFMPH